MTGKFSGDAGRAVASGKVVNGTDVVKTTTSDVVAAGSIGTSHDPRGSERDGVDLVCAVGVPDDELTVLRSRDEMPSVSRPVHGVDLCEMALEGTLSLHLEARKSLCALASNIANCDGLSDGCAVSGRWWLGRLTGCVGELILLLLYAVLEGFCISASD